MYRISYKIAIQTLFLYFFKFLNSNNDMHVSKFVYNMYLIKN